MKLMWLGTASLLLGEGSDILAFDPFPGIPMGALDGRPRTLLDVPLYRRASHVFVTHGHFDHILYIPQLYKDTDVVVRATDAPCATLLRHGMPERQLLPIAPGWSGEAGRFRVSALQGRHCRFDARLIARTVFRRSFFSHPAHTARLLGLNREYPENGETLFYELTDGTVRVQIMGSMGLDPGVVYPTDADWLILPYQGKSAPAEYALGLIARLKPRAVLLDHYDDAFPPMSSRIPTDDITGLVQERMGISCRALKKYETITL